jgi:O-antigen/teichoic acid export membrane protein
MSMPDAGEPTVLEVDDAPARPGLRHSLSWSFVSGIGAGALLFAQLIVAGRLLGPEQFGTFSFVQSVAMVLLIPALMGFDLASSRAIARSASRLERQTLAASSIAAVAACSLIASSFVVILADPLGDLLGTSGTVLVWSAAFTVLLAQRWLMERHLSGLGRFRPQAFVRLAEAAATIMTFVVLQATGTLDDYRSLVLAYSVGAVVVIIGAHLVDGHRPVPRDASWTTARGLLLYGTLMNGSYLFSTLLFQADRFAVNATLGPEQLGIYAAYASATVFVVIQLLLVTSNVLYPAMAREPDKRAFVHRIDRLALPALAAGALVLLGLLAMVLQLFGSSYPFDLELALLFTAWASLAMINGTYAVIVNAHSERSAARELAFQPIRLVFLVVWFATFGLSDQLTLELAATGMLLSELLEAVNLRLVLRGYVLVASAGADRSSGNGG